ncbi:MAG: hypothetical protein ACI85I_002725 [Arenicella sp.]|jgi:hypothetical protein
MLWTFFELKAQRFANLTRLAEFPPIQIGIKRNPIFHFYGSLTNLVIDVGLIAFKASSVDA